MIRCPICNEFLQVSARMAAAEAPAWCDGKMRRPRRRFRWQATCYHKKCRIAVTSTATYETWSEALAAGDEAMLFSMED